ncbi:MAG: PIN domain-containing protein [Solirubrobacteraceae bacterium]
MPGIYLDTSALGRVVLGEADAPAIRARLAQFDPWRASELLVVESRRLGKREGVMAAVEAMLGLVKLTALRRTLLEEASLIDPVEVRSLDAIHLATARGLHAAGEIVAVLTYDRQLQVGCQHHGIPVEAPTP